MGRPVFWGDPRRENSGRFASKLNLSFSFARVAKEAFFVPPTKTAAIFEGCALPSAILARRNRILYESLFVRSPSSIDHFLTVPAMVSDGREVALASRFCQSRTQMTVVVHRRTGVQRRIINTFNLLLLSRQKRVNGCFLFAFRHRLILHLLLLDCFVIRMHFILWVAPSQKVQNRLKSTFLRRFPSGYYRISYVICTFDTILFSPAGSIGAGAATERSLTAISIATPPFA